MISLWNFSQPDLWRSSFILAKLSPEPCQEGDCIRIGRPRQFAGSLSMYDSDSLWAAFSHRTLEWRHHSFSISLQNWFKDCNGRGLLFTALRFPAMATICTRPTVMGQWSHGVGRTSSAWSSPCSTLSSAAMQLDEERGVPEDVSTIHGAGSSRCSTRCLSRHPVMTPAPLCTLPQPQGPHSIVVWKAGSACTSQKVSGLLRQIKVRILMLFPKKVCWIQD